MLDFPEIWVFRNREWRLENRVGEFGEHHDGPDDDYRELTEEERITLLECVNERGSFGEYQEYVDSTGFKPKTLLYRSIDDYGDEWDDILESAIIDKYDDLREWKHSLEDCCSEGLFYEFAKTHPDLVTYYGIWQIGYFVLAINERVFPEVARQAFLSWAEKLLLDR